MSMEAAAALPLSPVEQLRYACEIIRAESQALDQLAEQLDVTFCRAVDLIYHCQGSVLVTGMGKAGLIGRKISATLASTGTRSHYVHPGEAFHGDLGRIDSRDVVLVLSQSGETEEVARLLPSLRAFGVPVIAVTARPESRLGRSARVVLELGTLREACSLGLAPSTSTTVMLALGDALALVTSRLRDFRAEDFARFHPGGALGRKLSKVDDLMRPLAECRVASANQTVRQVFAQCVKPGRRTGAIMLTGEAGRLAGIFTDSDLARLFEHHRESALDGPISQVMTRDPATIRQGAQIVDAVEIMAGRKISELPVVATDGTPIGLIDITDLAGMIPEGDTHDTDDTTQPTIALFRQTDDRPGA